EFDTVEPEIFRRYVEQSLPVEIGLVPTRAAIGSDRRLVGELQRNRNVDVGNAVWPGEELCNVARTDHAVGAVVGADIGPGFPAPAKDDAVSGAGDLDLTIGFARMVAGDEVFATILEPQYRATKPLRREGYEEILGIELAARPEAAADIVLDEFDRLLGHVDL